MDTNRYKLILAALLHDIGKFYQRGDEYLNDAGCRAKPSLGIADYICPKDEKGKLGYQHVIWTHQFFLDKIATFDKLDNGIFRVNPFDKQTIHEDNLVNLAIFHHNPQTDLQALVQLADSWGSGMDRTAPSVLEEENLAQQDQANYQKYAFKKVPLRPLFQEIRVQNGNPRGDYQKEYGYKLEPLGLENAFPVEITSRDSKQNEYKELWSQFSHEFDSLPTGNLEAFTESLLYMLRKYTWCIPSDTSKMRDVNLFEHLKTTAAIADCLFCYRAEHPDAFESNQGSRMKLRLKKGHFPLRLLCCDISGIQNFIYNIANQNAAKSLKGRSFYVQLLVDVLAQKILDETQTTPAHIVYASGGKFYLLLPNTESVRKAIEDVRLEAEKKLYAMPGAKLYPCMDSVAFACKDSDILIEGEQNPKTLGQLWEKAMQKAEKRKFRKYESLIDEQFFMPRDPYEGIRQAEICAVSGEIVEASESNKLDTVYAGGDREKNVYVAPAILLQSKLGERLKDADYYVLFKEKPNARDARKCIEPGGLGYFAYIKDEDEHLKSADRARIRRLNTTDFSEIQQIRTAGLNSASYGFMFYGGNKQALDREDRLKTFDKLVEDQTHPESRFKRMGILRMDVDGLGAIFRDGFEAHRRSFAAYATLSSQLDWFFAGYLNQIREKYKDWVNILYSGGDDVFALGRWDQLIDFAQTVRDEFRRFVCGREDISISAGLVLVGEKFPISKSAKMAGEAEDEAKNFVSFKDKTKKNAINFLGQNISWDQEWKTVRSWKEELISCYEKEYITKAVINKIVDFWQMKESKKPDWQWLTVYYFSKRRKSEENKAFNDYNKTLMNRIRSGESGIQHERALDLLAVAARWAELEIRTKSKNE